MIKISRSLKGDREAVLKGVYVPVGNKVNCIIDLEVKKYILKLLLFIIIIIIISIFYKYYIFIILPCIKYFIFLSGFSKNRRDWQNKIKKE